MMTNMCLGTTIFTFGCRAKEIGLIWVIVFCFVVGAVDYWSIINVCVASSKVDVDDYSEITEKILNSIPKQNRKFVRQQLNKLDDNFSDYVCY